MAGELGARFRRSRMARFVAELAITPETRVLDIGGTPGNWQWVKHPPRLTLLNMPRAGAEMSTAADWVAGDGCQLPFRDGAFDVVFSNSVIEHVGSRARQQSFAREVVRVGRNYWVQTPNRWFPVEQHLLTPFLHWLPRTWQRSLMPRLNLWQRLVAVSADRRDFYVEHYLRDVRLLGAPEMRELFPRSRLLRERFFGWTKSLIAVRKDG